MACFMTKWGFVTILYAFLMQTLFIVSQQQAVPCMYLFGDSQFDNGNNNNLVTRAKANYPPYGIDYQAGPTGRFCNGKIIPDFLAQFLGFPESIPAFASARGFNITKGLNYASGGAGILEESGIRLGDRISLSRQVLNHQTTISRLAISQRKSLAAVKEDLKKCLYVVNMGTNDYINNYLQPPFYPSSLIYTPDQYAEVLIRQFSRQISDLYDSGARKMAVFGLGLVGCLPDVLSRYPTNGSPCVDFINNDVQLFNNKLVSLIENFNTNLVDAKFTYINFTSIAAGDPSALGVTVVNAPCCPVSSIGQCAPNQVPCGNRNQYVFYDNFHVTELLNLVFASKAYNATVSTDAYPVDIRRLVQL